jgi:predicted nucleic acid-binding Zn ribbon protein
MMANQCVICGAEMPEGDQVCKACRDGNSKNGAIVKRKSALAENLRKILTEEGISVAMLAEWSGVSLGTIRGWVYYDRVAKKHSPNLKRVADVLRVSVDELRGSRNEGEGK